MQVRKRGQTRRVPMALLPVFMNGTLPEDTKAIVYAAVQELDALWAIDQDALIPPSMLARLTAAIGCPTLQAVDMLRILLGLSPRDDAHARRNLSACLRDKAARLGRSPTAADFPSEHPIRVLAQTYWGGIDAWGHDRATRAQLPRGYWAERAHQATALRDAAARFPGEPITHALLHRAGYHALARRLDAAALAELATACGLVRALRKGSAADWTAGRVVHDYVALCRSHGVTLSSDALRQLGGAASSLRSHAVRQFGSHAALVRTATAAHADIRPLNRPTTPDGIVLGSWAEVRVHAALRRGLPPDTVIRPHVPLAPELPRHSCDAVVSRDGRSVWVETLMVDKAAMVHPDANATVRRYAARWHAKADWYAAKAVTLVTVEPYEVLDGARMDAIVAGIRQHLEPPADGCTHEVVPPAPPPADGTIRPRHFWTENTLCQAVRSVAGSGTAMPTDAAMIAAGLGGAAQAIREHGWQERIAGLCGLRLVHRRGAWTEARVEEELVAWAQKHGSYPTSASLTRTGHGPLDGARRRLFSRRTRTLRSAVEHRCGLAPGGSAPSGSYDTPETLAKLLRPLCDRLGRFPTGAEMAEAGMPTTVYDRVSRGGGMGAMAAWMGFPRRRAERLTREAAITLLLTAAAPALIPGEPPRITTLMIRNRLGSRGIGILSRKIGGIAALRRAAADRARAAGDTEQP